MLCTHLCQMYVYPSLGMCQTCCVFLHPCHVCVWCACAQGVAGSGIHSQACFNLLSSSQKLDFFHSFIPQLAVPTLCQALAWAGECGE